MHLLVLFQAYFPDGNFMWHIGQFDTTTPLQFFQSTPPVAENGMPLPLPTCAETFAANGTCQTTPTPESPLVCTQQLLNTSEPTCTSQWDSISVISGVNALILSDNALETPAYAEHTDYFSSQSGGNKFYVINHDRGAGMGTRWGFSWSNAAGLTGAGGGIGRTGVSSDGTFSAGDWYQFSGEQAPNGDQKFTIAIYAR